MIKILVSGASGIVGYGILKSLKKSGLNVQLYASTIYTNSAASVFSDFVIIAPLTKSSNYLNWLCETIYKYKIDVIIPGIEDDLYYWNQNRDIISKTGVNIILNRSELIESCKDKWIFYNQYKTQLKTYLIDTYENFNILEFPFIAKPKRGFGSKGIYRICNDIELITFKSLRLNDYIFQPYIGSDEFEYSVSAFFDENSNLIDFMPLRRELSKDGFTEFANYEDKGFEKIIVEIGNVILPIGPINFQFRLDEIYQFKLLEINPRISSATSIRTLYGYNESQLSIECFFLKERLQNNSKLIKNTDFKVIRYIEDFILYDSNN